MYPKICSFGECMIEIIHQDTNKYNSRTSKCTMCGDI